MFYFIAQRWQRHQLKVIFFLWWLENIYFKHYFSKLSGAFINATNVRNILHGNIFIHNVPETKRETHPKICGAHRCHV